MAMTATVPVGLEDLKDRVEDYRDRLASLGLAMAALQRHADDLLAAIERDCLELQNTRSLEATATQSAHIQPVAVSVADARAETEMAAESGGEAPADGVVTDDLAAASESVPVADAGAESELAAGSSGNDPADDVVVDDVAAPSEAAPPSANTAPRRPDDLTLIKGIDTATADVLAGLGLTTFAELADLYQEDVEEIDAALSDPRRVSRECWIEQAAILATGQATAYVRAPRCAEPAPPAADPNAMPADPATPVGWAPCFAPLQADLLPAAGPDFVLPRAGAGASIENQLAEARAAVTANRRGISRRVANPQGARGRARSARLARHRRVPRANWKVAMTTAAAFALATISGTIVVHDGLQRELAARLVRLGTCTVESIPTNQDCAVLAWLSL
jgi:predicted flap endonuclease-1-like 5' DNA nuclease